ncbi:hypothetical protein M1N44_03230 [Dehalococcoidia bacterium]|nr:hypothetical protein [Dehalococcoidia bacterium]
MKLPNRRKLIFRSLMVLFAIGFFTGVAAAAAHDARVFEKEWDDKVDRDFLPGHFERSLERVIPGVLVARLELRGFANSLSTEERKAIRDDVEARAHAEGLMPPGGQRMFTTPANEDDGRTDRVAYGHIIGPDGVPRSMNRVTNEGAVASAHQQALAWFKEMTRRLTEHSYNRESMTRVIPGVFAGRLELRPLADPLSDAEKEALRADVIARARAEGFLDAEHPEQDSLLRRLGGEPAGPFLNVEKKRGPHHIAYGYVVDSEGRPWTFEVSVNNEKEAAWVHQEAREWFGMFEGKQWGPY